MDHEIESIPINLSDLQGDTPIASLLNLIFHTVQSFSSWQGFNWRSASRGHSAIAELLVETILTCISTVCSKWNKSVFFSSWAHSKIVIFGVSGVSFKVSQFNAQSLTCVRRQQMKIVVTWVNKTVVYLVKVCFWLFSCDMKNHQ